MNKCTWKIRNFEEIFSASCMCFQWIASFIQNIFNLKLFCNLYIVAASIVLGYVSIVFLKLISYHMVNFWCRESPVPIHKVRRRSVSSDRGRSRGKFASYFRWQRNIVDCIYAYGLLCIILCVVFYLCVVILPNLIYSLLCFPFRYSYSDNRMLIFILKFIYYLLQLKA